MSTNTSNVRSIFGGAYPSKYENAVLTIRSLFNIRCNALETHKYTPETHRAYRAEAVAYAHLSKALEEKRPILDHERDHFLKFMDQAAMLLIDSKDKNECQAYMNRVDMLCEQIKELDNAQSTFLGTKLHLMTNGVNNATENFPNLPTPAITPPTKIYGKQVLKLVDEIVNDPEWLELANSYVNIKRCELTR